MTTHSEEIAHAHDCAYQHGRVCNCPAFKSWLRAWAASVSEDTRGIDYSRYTAAEGINDEEGE